MIKNNLNQVWIFLSRPTSLYIVQAILVSMILFFGLNLFQVSLEVPFVFIGDAMHHLTIAHSIDESGWWWEIKRLSAPFTLDMIAFPVGGTLDYLIMKIIALIVDGPGYIINIFWLFTFVLTAAITTWSFKILGLSSAISFTLGVLYAFIPHVFARNISHLMLVIYLVPAISAAAILIVRGKYTNCTKKERIFFSIACIAVGMNYIYTAFFASFVLMVSGLLCLVIKERRKSSLIAFKLVLIITLTAFLNLLPTLIYWQGDNIAKENIAQKSVAESEIYGLKLRHLITPIKEHPLYLWQEFEKGSVRAGYPLENENSVEKLGTIGSLGFLMLLVVSLAGALTVVGRKRILTAWQSVASLNLAVLLLATIGGFGAIFNLLITPDIRTYNRIAVFTAFFSFYAVGLVLVWLKEKADRRIMTKIGFMSLFPIVIFIGILDQASFNIFGKYEERKVRYELIKGFVEKVELSLPKNAMVYQMPYLPYPHTPYLNRMATHEHLKPYIVSNNIRWSWPSLSGKAIALNQYLSSISAQPNFIKTLNIIGFDGIWIDLYGYSNSSIIKKLKNQLSETMLISSDKRYIFFSLVENKKELEKLMKSSEIRELRKDLFNVQRTILDKPLADDAFRAIINIDSNPITLITKEVQDINIRLRNNSAVLFPAKGHGKFALRLAYRWKTINNAKVTDYHKRFPLNRDLEPGKEQIITIVVEAPKSPGKYKLEVDLVQESVAWFGDRDSTTGQIEVSVIR